MPVILRWLLRLGLTNPITVRLVQNGSRRTRHMYIRSAYLAVLIVVLLWSLLIGLSGDLSWRDLAAKGAASFTVIAFLQITLICVLAPVFMAGAIAQESSPRTWEVLLTTPLTAAQIVLGNLLGRLFFILALLFCSLPLFALTQYFGGVPGTSILLSYLIAGCAALVVGTIAIALSVSRLVGKRAVFAFYVSVISYLALTIGIDQFQGGSLPGVRVTYMTSLNPFLALYALLNPTTYAAAAAGTTTGLGPWFLEKPVTTFCVIALGVSFCLIVMSTFTVRAGGLGMLTGDSGGTPWYRRMFGLAAAGSEHRAPRSVWTNPIAWREAAARNATLGRIVARWSFIALGGLFGLGIVVAYHMGNLSTPQFQLALMFTVMGEIAVTSLVAINMAATAVSREREDGTLDLLLTTPITASGYLWGKLRGLIAYLLPLLGVPLGTLAAACGYIVLCQVIDGFAREGGVTYSKSLGSGTAPLVLPAVLPEAVLIMTLVTLPFIAACVMVGLQMSLKSKGTISSVVATVGMVGVVGGLAGLCAWKAGGTINLLGAMMVPLTPATGIYAMLYPVDGMGETVTSGTGGGGLTSARVAAGVGAALAAGVYLIFIYMIHANMVRTFDVTVRRLAGTK